MARHFEPFVHLAGLTHDDVLVAWGGFWFAEPDGSLTYLVTSTPDGEQVAGPIVVPR